MMRFAHFWLVATLAATVQVVGPSAGLSDSKGEERKADHTPKIGSVPLVLQLLVTLTEDDSAAFKAIV